MSNNNNYMGFEAVHTSPFYFISYSRTDINKVKKITKPLHDKGVPLWYDKAIDYGTKWKHVIGEKIIESDAILMFITYELLNRDDTYVEKEHAIASKNNKKILVILLDNIDVTKIPAKNQVFFAELMELNVINAYEMEQNYLLQEIISAINFKLPEPQKEKTDSVKEQTVSTDNSNECKDISSKKDTGFLNSKFSIYFIRTLKILMITLGILFILLIIIIYSPDRKKTNSSYTSVQSTADPAVNNSHSAGNNLFSVTEPDNPVTVTEPETEINLSEFSDKDTAEITAELENITDSDAIILNRCTGSFKNVVPLIIQNSYISRLVFTDCSFDEPIDFSDFTQLQNLETITISGCKLDTLKGMDNFPNLRKLNVSRNSLTTLEGLEKSIYLFSLNISDNQIEDISGMSNCSILEYFNAANNKIKDFSLLSKSSLFLRQICLSGNNAELDLSFLAESTSLEMLDISSNTVKSLSPVTSKKLQYLWLDNCGLTDFDLQYYSNLKVLSAGKNQLSNIYFNHNCDIEYLYLSENKIKGSIYIYPDKLKVLDLHGNQIDDLQFNTKSDAVIELFAYSNPITGSYNLYDCSFNTYISYNDSFTYSINKILNHKVNFVDCPLDKQALLEKTMETEEGVFNITSEQAIQEIEKCYKSYADYSYKW